MKITYIADASSVHVVEWIKFFIRKGYEISVITDVDARIEGAKVCYIGDCLPSVRIPFLSATYQIFAKVKKIQSLLQRIKPDIIHAHFATNYGYLAANTGFHPYVLTCHGSDILVDLNRSRIEHHFVKTALQRADYISLPSEQMQRVIQECGIPSERIFRIQYGVDTEAFPFSKKIGKESVILSTRTLTYKYRIDVLVEAAKRVIEQNKPVQFQILGDGVDKEQFEELAYGKYHLNKELNFTGSVDHDDITRYFQNAHIYVSTSPSDGISISLLEAFASGCYPIVPDIPSNNLLRDAGYQMELFRVNNSLSLAKSIVKVVDSLAHQKEALRKNRRLVEKEFSRHKNLERFNHVYEKYAQLL